MAIVNPVSYTAGRRLSHLREWHGLTRQEVLRWVPISYGYLRMIEDGASRNVSISTAGDLSLFYGVTPALLMSNLDDPNHLQVLKEAAYEVRGYNYKNDLLRASTEGYRWGVLCKLRMNGRFLFPKVSDYEHFLFTFLRKEIF